MLALIGKFTKQEMLRYVQVSGTQGVAKEGQRVLEDHEAF
jgi:hypothetical protein